MPGSFTVEQEELRRYVRQWLEERAPLEEVRRLADTETGYDRGHWQELGELGWLGMAVPEKYGGAGFGFAELAVMAEEMGRSLYPSPFLATVVTGAALVEFLGTDDQRAELLAEVAAGKRTLAVALPTTGGAEPAMSAWEVDGGWLLRGAQGAVLDGHSADTLLVPATTDAGTAVFLIDPSQPGVERRRLDVMDQTRPLAAVGLDDVHGELLGGPGPADDSISQALHRAVGALAMEQVGGAQACLDMSVAYAKQRHQFGRPIGSFQAIKHMCAEMLVAVESARSAAYHLALTMDHDAAEVEVAAPLAKSYASEAYLRCAGDSIQVHGGIGFTWEHHAHLYLKRAKSSQLLFGSPAHHRRLLAERLGL